MRSITEEDVCETLARYEEKTLLYRKKILELESLLRNASAVQKDLIYAASLPGKSGEEIFSGTRNHRDLSDVMKKYYQLEKDHITDIASGIRHYSDELDVLNRIMVCYSLLPFQEHQVLEALYRNSAQRNESGAAARFAAKKDVDIRTVFRWRKKALTELMERYHQPISTRELK